MNKVLRKFSALLLALAVLCAASLAAAETKITVTGTGETQVSADTAVISLGVSARNKDVIKAQQQVNASIAAIREVLIEKGVPEENINTDYISIYAMYDYEGDAEQLKAYSASTTLAVKVEKVEDTGMLIDAAFSAGANTLNGISFSASDTAEAESASLKDAVAKARAKAEVLAEASGLKITGIEVISEGGVFSYGNDTGNFNAKRMEMAEADEAGGTVVQAAKLIVTASVTITFTAE